MRRERLQGMGGNTVRALAAASMLLGAVGSASAGDGNFFEQLFGGGEAQQPAPQPQYDQPAPDMAAPRYERHTSRPLTVRLHRPKVHVAQVPTKPGKVSIFEDTTLRRGDAVMTAKGMRIFAGSRSLPYSESDFVAVSDAGRLDRGLQKTLIALDNLPR